MCICIKAGEAVLPDLVPPPALDCHAGNLYLPIARERLEEDNVARLKHVGGVGRKTKNDDALAFGILDELEGSMGVVAIKDKEAHLSGCVVSSLKGLEHVLQPVKAMLLIGPAILGDSDAMDKTELEAILIRVEPRRWTNLALRGLSVNQAACRFVPLKIKRGGMGSVPSAQAVSRIVIISLLLSITIVARLCPV